MKIFKPTQSGFKGELGTQPGVDVACTLTSPSAMSLPPSLRIHQGPVYLSARDRRSSSLHKGVRQVRDCPRRWQDRLQRHVVRTLPSVTFA